MGIDIAVITGYGFLLPRSELVDKMIEDLNEEYEGTLKYNGHQLYDGVIGIFGFAYGEPDEEGSLFVYIEESKQDVFCCRRPSGNGAMIDVKVTEEDKEALNQFAQWISKTTNYPFEDMKFGDHVFTWSC